MAHNRNVHEYFNTRHISHQRIISLSVDPSDDNRHIAFLHFTRAEKLFYVLFFTAIMINPMFYVAMEQEAI